jgi:hypothetical protein
VTQNMLIIMEICRDLKKCKMDTKIDSYYISTVALRIFTTSEMARYMREQSDMERLFEEESRKAASVKKHSTIIDGLADIDAIASDDEGSDAETAVYSFASNSEAVDQDIGSKRTRRFFFKFIEQSIATIRRMESNIQLLGREEKQRLKGKLPGTSNFQVETTEDKCILQGCGKVHTHPKFKRVSKSLQFCAYFAGLKLGDRRKKSTEAKICTRCLSTGHRHSECKSSIVCKHCQSDSHHVLLCTSLEQGGKKKDGDKGKDKGKKVNPKAADPKKTSTHKTDTEEDEAESSAGESEGAEGGVTTTHFGKNFELSTVESFFLQKSAKVDRSLTMVSTVMLKDGKH